MPLSKSVAYPDNVRMGTTVIVNRNGERIGRVRYYDEHNLLLEAPHRRSTWDEFRERGWRIP